MKIEARVPLANRLLAALPRSEYLAMLPHLESVELAVGDVLAEAGEPAKYVYFSHDALISLLTVVDQTHALEVALVGREGMVGVSLALGAAISPMRATVQRPGSAMRMRAPLFRRELKRGLSLHREVLLYTHHLMAQLARTAACNRFHLIEARLAHRLLVTRDRMGTNHFSFTHEFLGQMLGVRRVGVTTAAQALKTRSLIEYSRGNIAIIDGRGLEKAACTCYLLGNDFHRKKWVREL